MGEPDVLEKLDENLEPIIPNQQIRSLVDRVHSLEDLPGIDSLTALLELAD
jgi:hypothetical protein